MLGSSVPPELVGGEGPQLVRRVVAAKSVWRWPTSPRSRRGRGGRTLEHDRVTHCCRVRRMARGSKKASSGGTGRSVVRQRGVGVAGGRRGLATIHRAHSGTACCRRGAQHGHAGSGGTSGAGRALAPAGSPCWAAMLPGIRRPAPPPAPIVFDRLRWLRLDRGRGLRIRFLDARGGAAGAGHRACPRACASHRV